jgi:hypothetical protein
MTRPGASARPCGLLSLNPYSSPGPSMFSNSGSVSYRFWRRLRANNTQRSLLTIARTPVRVVRPSAPCSMEVSVALTFRRVFWWRRSASRRGILRGMAREASEQFRIDARDFLSAREQNLRRQSLRANLAVLSSIPEAEREKRRGTGVRSRFTRPVHAVLETVYQSLPGGFDDVLGNADGSPHALAVRRVYKDAGRCRRGAVLI